jgi:hypothetical protein
MTLAKAKAKAKAKVEHIYGTGVAYDRHFRSSKYFIIQATGDLHSILLIIAMEQPTFFPLSLIVEGTTEKVSQFIRPLKSIYQKDVGFFVEKKIAKKVLYLGLGGFHIARRIPSFWQEFSTLI